MSWSVEGLERNCLEAKTLIMLGSESTIFGCVGGTTKAANSIVLDGERITGLGEFVVRSIFCEVSRYVDGERGFED